jgi:hypothetical protein
MLAVAAACFTWGCSSSSSGEKAAAAPAQASTGVAASSNPAAKYIELVGFRITEKSPGKLQGQFGVVNHSEADIGDLGLKVKLTTSAAKPEDPPVADFEAKVPSVGPHEIKDVTVTVPTKLRIYELPDWQFLRAQFEITSPAP